MKTFTRVILFDNAKIIIKTKFNYNKSIISEIFSNNFIFINNLINDNIY
jgi:hypothetical protein